MMPTSNHSVIGRVCRLAGCVLLATALSGCSEENRLDGMFGKGVNLEFDQAGAYWLNQELVIAYQRSYTSRRVGGHLENQVTRLVFMTERVALAESEKITFLWTDEPRALLVDHYVISEDSLGILTQEPNFTPYTKVQVFFSALGKKPGESLTGYFHCKFIDNEALWGDFDVTLRKP